MKIGLVCPYRIDRHGGVLEVVLALKSGLEKRGHIVKIITPEPRDHDEEVDGDVIFVGTSTDFRTLSFSDTTSQVSSASDNEKIDAMLAEEKFDVLHFHEPWMPLLSRQLLTRSTCVNIGTFHSKVTDAALSRAIIKMVNPYLKSVLKYLDALTAVSRAGADYAEGMTDEPITIIPNGIDLEKYTPVKQLASHQRTILFVGRLERRKGVKYLLQAFQIFQQNNPDVRLLIAGDGPDREKLELLTEDLKLKNVRFLGFIPEDEKRELLAECDLFCSPALFGESFGIVLLEAMASGAVTLAGSNVGYDDVMQGLGRLSLITPTDIEDFARRMDLMLNSDELRKLWSAWAKPYVEQFSYEHVVEQYEKFYIDSIKSHGKA